MKMQPKKPFKQLPPAQKKATLAKYKSMPEMAEGLADLQKSYLYSKKKQQEESDYQASLRPNKNQKTLGEKYE